MAALTAAAKKKMPKKEFGIPKKRGFPMGDKKHDRLAIGGATRSYKAGNISKGTEDRIKSEARKKLGISNHDNAKAKHTDGHQRPKGYTRAHSKEFWGSSSK